MPTQRPAGIRQMIFLPGVADYLPADLLQDNESSRLENADVHRTGTLRRRGGLVARNTQATGTPINLGVFSAKGHGPALCSIVNTTSGQLVVDPGVGNLLTIPLGRNIGLDSEMVQILDRLYILEKGLPPIYWQWGNVQGHVASGTATGMPNAASATFFRGRCWAGLDDLLYFSRHLGAIDYDTFLNESEAKILEEINTSNLSEETKVEARNSLSGGFKTAKRTARNDAKRRAKTERHSDQDGFPELIVVVDDVAETYGLTVTTPEPTLSTETAPGTETRDFLWDTEFQAFRTATGKITKILPYRDNALLIFTEHGIEVLEPDPFDVLSSVRNTFSLDIGSPFKNTVQVAGEDVYFMDQDGHLRSLLQTELEINKGVLNSPLSLKIQNVIDRQTKDRLHTARSVFHNGIYWIFMPLDGAQLPTEGWGFSVRDQSWVGPITFTDLQNVSGLAAIRFTDDRQRLFTLLDAGTDAVTYRFLDPADRLDITTAIPFEWRSANYTARNPSQRKEWVSLDIEARVLAQLSLQAPSSFVLRVRGDEGEWKLVGNLTLNTQAGPRMTGAVSMGTLGSLGVSLNFNMIPDLRQRLKSSLTGLIPRSHGLQVELASSSTASDFEILGTTLWALIDPEEYEDSGSGGPS